jgi:hypothetical protein
MRWSIQRERSVRTFLFVLALFLMTATSSAAGAEPADSLAFLGTYFLERFTEEHHYQYQLDLWTQGSAVLALSSSIEGLMGGGILPTIQRFEGTLQGDTLRLSERFRGVLRDSILVGTYLDGDDFEMEFLRSSDPMEIGTSSAPRTGSAPWRTWADRVIDDMEARTPYLQQQRVRCASGDAWACVGIGNGYKDRKPEEARRYWKRGCDGGAWPGCKFLGDSTRYHALLRQLCSRNQEPSLHRNMACEVLGGMAEQTGRRDDAIRWYQLGCNGHELPLTCCRRLKALGGKPTLDEAK